MSKMQHVSSSLKLALSVLVLSTLVTTFTRAEIITDSTPVPPAGTEGGPIAGLSAPELDQWMRGRKVFDRDWKLAEGLGTPELNADSCRSCHQHPIIGAGGGLDTNVFRFGSDNNGNGPFSDLPGGQVASKLRRPDMPGREESNLSADVFEVRQTPSALGLGLVDTIFEAAILANEDPFDTNGDGVRGVARMLNVAGFLEVGRFGWKAQVPTVQDFARDALGGETGITVPDDGRGFGALTDGDSVADPEILPGDFADLVFYLETLAAPPRAGGTDPAIAAGEALFSTIGCATCHIPSLPGSGGPVPLYSDLLLHDIHPASFRGMGEPDAPVGMYKTPVLWGVRNTAPYLHDGSATTLADAIDAHDDEAALVRAAFDNLTPTEQAAVLAFLADL